MTQIPDSGPSIPPHVLPGVPFCRREGRFLHLGEGLSAWAGRTLGAGALEEVLSFVRARDRGAVEAAWRAGRTPGSFSFGSEALGWRTLNEVPGAEGWGLWLEQPLQATALLVERLGYLAGGVVHEVNNPLAGVLNYVRVAQRLAKAGADPRLVEFLEGAEGEAERILAITRTLLELSPRPGSEGPRPVQPLALLHLALLVTRTSLRDAGLRYRLEEPAVVLPRVRDLQQVAFSALFALLDDSRRCASQGSEVLLSAQPREGAVALCVEDDQARPCAQELDQAGFSGGALAAELIASSGGSLRVEPRPEGGSRVALELPAWVG